MISICLGLGCPLASGVPFHGARSSDVTTVAATIRAALPEGARLFAVGLSLGGIIVSSAVCKEPKQRQGQGQGQGETPRLAQFVDGAVSISGCFDGHSNTFFRHSREIWQPALVRGEHPFIVHDESISITIY